MKFKVGDQIRSKYNNPAIIEITQIMFLNNEGYYSNSKEKPYEWNRSSLVEAYYELVKPFSPEFVGQIEFSIE